MNLGISCDTRMILSKLEEAHDKTIFNAVRKFYVASKIEKSLFGENCLKDLGALQPERTASYL